MAYEPFSRMILVLWLSWTRNSLQAEKFLKHWLGHMVGIQYRQRVPYGTAMHVEVLGLSITVIERVIQSLKDRVECFDNETYNTS
jgi:hypothetical protein